MQTRLTEAAQGLSKFELDHRVLRPDGKMLWITTHGELVRDADDDPVRLLVTAHDISERKAAEREKADAAEQLRRYAERLEACRRSTA